MKRTSGLILLTALLLAASSCGEAQNVPQNTPDSGELSVQTEAVTEEAEPTTADLIRQTYAETDLGGYEFRILAPGSGGHFYYQVSDDCNETWFEAPSGDVMNDAVYERNLMTEELLNIKIVPVFENDTQKLQKQIQNSVTAGADDFDVALNRMDFLGASMTAGYLLNFYDIETIDLTNPWWDANIVRDFTLFGNRLYFLAGDINFLDDYAVEVIYFNKRLSEEADLSSPYEAVNSNTWNLDTFYSMCKAVERDVNGDGKIVMADDLVGHAEVNDMVKHWIYPMGERSIDIGLDGSLSLQILTEHQVNAIDRLFDVMVNGTMSYMDDQAVTYFIDGHALFLGNMLGSLNKMRDMKDEFGVLPMPKLNAEQERYGEYISNGWTTAYGVPVTVSDANRAGTVMEVLCGMSTDTVRKALYDVLFSAKLVRDTDSVRMLDIIFASKSYDWAVDFSWGTDFQSLYNTIYTSKKNNFVSNAEKKEKALTKKITQLVEKIRELEN